MKDKRSEPRKVVDRFYSVEFLSKDHFVYQFKLRDLSTSGLCILVNESSAVLKQLQVGDTFEMTFNPPRAEGPPESLKTEIVHITKNTEEPFTGHVLIGLLILERKDVADD